MYGTILKLINENIEFLETLPGFFYFYIGDKINKNYEYKEKLKYLSKRYQVNDQDMDLILTFFLTNKELNYKESHGIVTAIQNIKKKEIFFNDLKNQKKILEKDNLWKSISELISNSRQNEINKINFILKLKGK